MAAVLAGCAADVPLAGPSTGDLATLLVFSSRHNAAFFMRTTTGNLRISVDGATAFYLGDGQCNAVLVPPGEHVVAAVSEFSRPLLRQYLKVMVKADERVAVRFIFDEGNYVSSTPFIDRINPEAAVAASEFFQATALPAAADDVCRLRQAPVILPHHRDPSFWCIPKLAAGKGRIWIYRTAPKGMGVAPEIVVDNSRYEALLPGAGYGLDVTPGRHEVMLEYDKDKLEIEVASGEDIFVPFDVDPALFGRGFYPVLVDRQTAKAELHQHAGIDFECVKD